MATAKKAAKKKAAPKKKALPMPHRRSYYRTRDSMPLAEAIAIVEKQFAPLMATGNALSALQPKLIEQFKGKEKNLSINIDQAIQSCQAIFSTWPDGDSNKTGLISRLVAQFNNERVEWIGGQGPASRSRRAAKKK